MLRCLLPTLYSHDHNTAIDCRKAPRGLIFPLEVPGLFTRIASSPDANLGQQRSGYSIHASRQLSGKVLRYLKRVIVTPAVYRCFLPLNRKFTYRHWAGIRSYTQPYGLAAPYVFIKQSDLSRHCDLLFHIEYRKQAPLLPKVRGQFAEFPKLDYPDSSWITHPGHQCRFSVRTWKIHAASFSLTPRIS